MPRRTSGPAPTFEGDLNGRSLFGGGGRFGFRGKLRSASGASGPGARICATLSDIDHAYEGALTMAIERDALGFDAPAPLGHPGRAGLPDGHPTGPEVGERLPDFILPDASGKKRRFQADRAGRPAVVVFYRSAVW